MKNISCIFLFLLFLCGCTSIDDYFIKKDQERHVRDIDKKYKNINFDDGITQQEADIIVEKFIIDNGWPWPLAGGRTTAIDKGDKWVFKYVRCFGGVDENSNGILVDKIDGKITREN